MNATAGFHHSSRGTAAALPLTARAQPALCKVAIDGAEYDKAYPQRLKETIY